MRFFLISQKGGLVSKLQHYKDLESKIKELESQLEKYKSIVKKVDADNLPKGEVLAFNFKGISFIGALEKDEDLIPVIARSRNSCLYNITHYINQKDLIELIGGVGK